VVGNIKDKLKFYEKTCGPSVPIPPIICDEIQQANVCFIDEGFRFLYGKLLPFSGLSKYVPNFLKEKSTTILASFFNIKSEIKEVNKNDGIN